MRTLVHPRLAAALNPGFYTSLGTVQQRAAAQDSTGQVVGTWSDILTDVPCAVGPERSDEKRTATGTVAIRVRTVALSGYYPAITAPMRLLVDGDTYDILAVDHSVGRHTTQLRVEKVTP